MKGYLQAAVVAAACLSVQATPIALGEDAIEIPALRSRQYSGDTYNQLTDGTPCRAVTLIYARGTNQAGNVGDSAAVGPLFFNSLASKIGTSNLAVQGVTYSASIGGFLQGGDPTGSQTMATLTAQVRREQRRWRPRGIILDDSRLT